MAGVTFAQPGTVTQAFGGTPQFSAAGSGAQVTFPVPEYAEFYFGNPLAAIDGQDFLLDLGNLRAGQGFSLTAAVPEPASLPLFGAGLALLVFGTRRFKR